MLSPRAPLFSVSIAFAIGCVLGFDGIPLSLALTAWLLCGLGWAFSWRREWLSLASFYAFVICSGLAHSLLLVASISLDDVRRLPEEKTFETTQWRGKIADGPIVQIPANKTRHTPERTTFALNLESWRPTGGRLYGADIDLPWRPAHGKIRCTLSGPEDALAAGDQIEFAAPVVPFPPALNPGELDQQEWEAQAGIYDKADISPLNWQLLSKAQRNVFQNFFVKAQNWAYERLRLGLEKDPDTADFLAGALIGDRKRIPADIEQNFRRTGTMHVFSVSGQNIAVMLLVIMTILQLGGLVRWRWGWMLIPLVLVYCLLTGSPASAIRATVMALALLLAWRLGRPLPALSCWALAFLIMLIWDPTMLLNFGAQLSFGVVLSLILFSRPLMEFMVRPFKPDPFLPPDLLTAAQRREEIFWRWTCGLLASGVAAAVVCEPISALDFHQIAPISVLANLIVIPTAGLITVVGTISIVFSLVSTMLAILCNNTNWLIAKGLIAFVGFLAHEPGAAINIPDLRTTYLPPPSFVVMSAQNSTSLLVRTRSGAWLVNAGKESASPSPIWRLLQFYGINQLDGLVLAQIGTTDNSGADRIARDFHPHRVIVPVLATRSPLEKNLSAIAGSSLEKWQQGSTIDLGSGITVEVLSPAPDSPVTKAEDRSLILLFHAGGQTLLWVGKAGPDAQKQILARYPNLHADVLVAAAEPWPDETWLHSIQPRHWLQIPSPTNDVETNATTSDLPDFPIWPLDKTGAVEVRFIPAQNQQPPEIQLHVWSEDPDPAPE